MMRVAPIILGIVVAANLVGADGVRAQDAAVKEPVPVRNCDVTPELLAAGDVTLAKVAAAISERKKLDVLVVGSGSSGLAGPEGASVAYPAKLEAALREQLPGVTVTVTPELQPKKTAEESIEALQKLAADRRPDLVIWQTGTIDAMRSVHPDDFRTTIEDGVGTLKGAGSDAILMNLQYSPRLETMVSLGPYLDNMRAAAQQQDVALFDRYSIMQHWNEQGQFDLTNTSRDFRLAKGVHYCLGRTLATYIIDAAKIDRATLKVQN